MPLGPLFPPVAALLPRGALAGLLPLLVGLLPACVDDAPETLTIVVDADRARAAADQQKLAQMQQAVDEARRELAATREDLKALRDKLLAVGALGSDEVRRLDERERRLAASAAGLGAEGNSPQAGLTRADVEALLLAQESRLAARLATGATAATEPGIARAQRVEVEGFVAELSRQREARGLHLSDLPRGRELQARVDAQLKGGRYDEALATARALGDEAAAVKVDLGFVQRKYARANALLGGLSGEPASQGKALLAEANARVAAGDATGASQKLSAFLLLTE